MSSLKYSTLKVMKKSYFNFIPVEFSPENKSIPAGEVWFHHLVYVLG
jgi:hypothetical protein